MNDSTPLVVTDVHKHFRHGQPVLNGVELNLASGTVTGLLGRNGAGKTTLMQIALGLMKPNEGEATLFGSPALEAPAEVRQRVGYVAQGDLPFSWLRVSDCLTLIGSFYEDWDRQLVTRYANEWDVDPTAYIQDLSKGQRQKVAILMAIGHRPDLLILDEPVASLDPGARRQFLKALVELNADLNRTILFSTHITSDLERVAADVAVLHHGRIAFHGELDTLKERCRRLYFNGSPLPEVIEEAGVDHYEQAGGRATAFARDWRPERTEALSRSLGVRVVDEPLPLEELFLELTHD